MRKTGLLHVLGKRKGRVAVWVKIMVMVKGEGQCDVIEEAMTAGREKVEKRTEASHFQSLQMEGHGRLHYCCSPGNWSSRVLSSRVACFLWEESKPTVVRATQIFQKRMGILSLVWFGK